MSEDFVLTKLEQIEAVVGEIRGHLKGASPELPFDPEKINFEEKFRTDSAGKSYRVASDQVNVRNRDYEEAKKLLEGGGGKFSRGNGASWLLLWGGRGIGVWDYKKRR